MCWILQSFYWIAKNKKQISKYKINPKNNKDDKCFQLALTDTLYHEKIHCSFDNNGSNKT